MNRSYYSNTITEFLSTDSQQIIGLLSLNNTFALETTQRDAWLTQIEILRESLSSFANRGSVYFEYSIPRLGRRIDTVLIIDHAIFVIEFKVGEKSFSKEARDQVWDYALDLKHFHETSHNRLIAPILISTNAKPIPPIIQSTFHNDGLLKPIDCHADGLENVIRGVLSNSNETAINHQEWEKGRYRPTPTIIEAALALYNGHNVEDISRRDADTQNLTETSDKISQIIHHSKQYSKKSICFVTGVPGAGKTLVGLNIATQHIDPSSSSYSVFLSGNDPLVKVLREALVRDKVRQAKEQGQRLTKKEAAKGVEAFIQNVHHFRDDCLQDKTHPPVEHVVLFDEAQRAWDLQQTTKFMQQKKRISDFNRSEPEFLISCLDRHSDWAVVVCLVGGGQEINIGEGGISEWIEALNRSFPHWNIYLSPSLTDSEYSTRNAISQLEEKTTTSYSHELHLSVSMRSYRAENVSSLVKSILDLNKTKAEVLATQCLKSYPIFITRDLRIAKSWLRKQARGSERYGIVASSQAQRLKPYAIDVRSPMNPVNWFLNGKADIRSSYFCEDVATEFKVQGLELDWACVTWDGDFRFTPQGWQHWAFKGQRWQKIKKPQRQLYLKNAYRVLLTRARQGMVIFIPRGNPNDHTRNPSFYDGTFEYLTSLGLPILQSLETETPLDSLK